ncbi:MAG: hypothetical protein ACK5H1_09955 [Tenacibaculum sp.]
MTLQSSRCISKNYTWTNNFKIKNKIELDLGLTYSRNKYKTDNETSLLSFENKFQTWRPFAEIAWVINDKMLFQAEYSYENQTNNNRLLNEYNDLNFSLRYKLFKKTYASLLAGNLLDNQLVTNSFNSNYTQIVSKKRLGSYYLINLKYKF